MEQMRENKMGTEREGKLLLSMGWPIIVSMLVQALYNIVDSIFVSRLSTLDEGALRGILGELYTPGVETTIGDKALNALSTVNPLQMLMISVAVGTAVGMNSLISRRLGERRTVDANRAAGNGMVLAVLSALVFTVIGLTLSRAFLHWQDTDPIVRLFGTEYMTICLSLCVGLFLSCCIERIMTAQGRTLVAMMMQLTGAITNIVLDRVFVLGLGPIPAMGVTGAAIATVIGQFASMTLALVMLVRSKSEIRLHLPDFRLSKQTIREIYSVGVPSILMQAVGTVMYIGMNGILKALGDYHAATLDPAINYVDAYKSAFGTYFRLQSIIFMPVFGLNNAAMSILGYNYGARNRKRFLRAYGMLTLFCASFMVLGTAIFELFAPQLMLLFAVSSFTYGVTLEAIRVIAWGFVCAAICIAMNTVYGATDTGLYGTITSLARQLFVLLPVAGLMAYFTHSIEAVWWAFPIAEFMTLLLSTFLTWKLYKKKIEPLGNRE
ncbi:MAG: polysaccharide biosynthesis C-terminal domain-containing protein [Clostridia bacterium]|nr:polysaccharide biosynthesis C-terminal domain-containing protein [Clostridia bacterium]